MRLSLPFAALAVALLAACQPVREAAPATAAALPVSAEAAGVPADDAFLALGQAMLQRMHEEGTVLGTRL